jgi:hypothetical protein
MGSLRFPEGAIETLSGEWPDLSNIAAPYPRIMIYSIDSVPREARELYRAARKSDIERRGSHMSESRWDEDSYLKPAKQDFAAPSLQDILDHHLNLVKRMRVHVERTQRSGDFDWEMFLWGFLAITRTNWREKGVTAVHWEMDRGKWKVTQCLIPITELSSIDNVVLKEEPFGPLCERFGGSDNDGPDNQGGPAPVLEWQFAVYCSANTFEKVYDLRYEARSAIPDPRGPDKSYPKGEQCLDFDPTPFAANLVRGQWPSQYTKFMRDPTVGGTRRLGAVRRHPSLFVKVINDFSNIEIIEMEWDHETPRSEDELQKIGRTSKTTAWECEAENLVATLEQLARGDREVVRGREVHARWTNDPYYDGN